PTVRTTTGAIHATDLVRIGGRVAFVSAMQMTGGSSEARAAGPAPMLVSLRYIDNQFLRGASQQNYLSGIHLADTPEPREDETSMPLTDSDGTVLTTMHWTPMLAGATVIRSLLVPAAGVFCVIALLV